MPRSDKGQIRITDRDIKILRWIGEQYVVRLDTLQKLLGRDALQETREEGFVRESAARRVIARWKQERLVETHKFFFNQPIWVWLSGKGLSDVGLDFKYWKPSASTTLNHYHEVNEIRLKTEGQSFANQITWVGERYLRKAHHNEAGFHIPDAEVIWGERTLAVEVELTQKSVQRVEDIVQLLAHQYAGVWYFVSPQASAIVERTTQGYGKQFLVQKWPHREAPHR